MTTIHTTARLRSRLARLAVLAPLVVAGVAAQAQGALHPEQSFEAAMQAYQDGRYPAAYGRFVKLASGGHAEAARIALAMHRYGPQLYGSQWDAAPRQLRDRLPAAARTGPAGGLRVKPRAATCQRRIGAAGVRTAPAADATAATAARPRRPRPPPRPARAGRPSAGRHSRRG